MYENLYNRVYNFKFSEGYGDKLKNALDRAYEQQFQQALSSSQEREAASGVFNADLSKYYATKGAGESMSRGKISALEAARQDEHNRFNAMLNAANLALQQQQYEESKPSWWESLLGGLSTGAGLAFPFLKFLKK